jgi:hypothetical protein
MIPVVRRDRLSAPRTSRGLAPDEGQVRGLDGDVRAGADGHADVGLGQRGRVVDAVTDHRHDPAAAWMAGDDPGLVGRQHLGLDALRRDARRPRPTAAPPGPVAGHQPDLDAGRLQLADGGGRVGLDRVVDEAGGRGGRRSRRTGWSPNAGATPSAAARQREIPSSSSSRACRPRARPSIVPARPYRRTASKPFDRPAARGRLRRREPGSPRRADARCHAPRRPRDRALVRSTKPAAATHFAGASAGRGSASRSCRRSPRVDPGRELERLAAADEDAGLGALPVPTMIAVGVARPIAQGQAMTTTVMNATSACVTRGSGPRDEPQRRM